MMKSKWKTLTTFALVTAFVFFIINLGSSFIIKSTLNVSYSDELEYKKELSRFKKEENRSFVHPFYGLNSNKGEQGFKSSISQEINFGTISDQPKEGAIKVLVLGGSVASHLSATRKDFKGQYLLSRMLNEKYHTDRFVVYNASLGGFKQPQQYFKWLYLDYLGFKPDVVINLDGFNEVALPLVENLPFKLNAIYPRSFDRSISSSSSDTRCIPLNNWLLQWDSKIPLIELVKLLFVRSCHLKVTGEKETWRFVSNELFEIEKDNYIDQIIQIWEQSSNKLNKSLSDKNIPYIHVIQANQYLKGSKVFSNFEKEKYLSNLIYGNEIEQHYKKLSSLNLDTKLFLDQRYLFKDTIDTVYVDDCCHFNKLGMVMIIEDIILKFDKTFRGFLDE